ncbi:putative prolyl aminopeptidase [Azorhizobium caulinodans ORS 571]|uniref:Putative prolyl aminopeptidase n=1 Tax=Azorhizobium caulinodans (strain ATCC 43989 / DSM 5975 / JCM 20966 / LMG 6465 / NBRC 14845 / NCIMB 13405 / ORS 571) TaxID=438753 RepID=A8INP1_AZOC5|nr:putative prolyl aminopeptidase [Azorhizobium caulinodans ORS 571]
MAGEGHDETIVVLHGGRGIGDHRADFQAFLPLTDCYRLLAYDQRGCGLSSLTPPYTFGQFADDLEAIRQELCGGGRIILIGGSFGGMIALTYAVKYGANGLSRLILRGTAPSHHHEAEAIANFKARLHKAPSASLRMVEKMFSDVIDDTELRLIWLALQPLYFETFDPDAALERTRTLSLHAETHNALFAVKDYDLRDQLPGIAVPTQVIVGGEDWICPPSQSRLIAERVPGAELLEIPGANHSVHIEANAQVLAGIRSFLERTAP